MLKGAQLGKANALLAVDTFPVTGQIQDTVAAHTASDIPLSAFGRGAQRFPGVMDNTDVFFKARSAALP